MCLFEYDQEQAMKSEREEGRAEGKENTILELVRDGLLSIEEAAKRLGVDVEELKEKLNN